MEKTTKRTHGESESNKNAHEEKSWWKNNWFIVVCGGLLLLVALIKFGSIFAFMLIFPFIKDYLVYTTGMNKWLAWAIAFPFTLILITISGLIFSWKKSIRQQGRAILCVSMASFFLFMFFIEKDYVYDIEGEATACYAQTPDGFEYVPCSWKVHRKYGTPVMKLPKGFNVNSWSKNTIPSSEAVGDNYQGSFFAPDGTPLLWYLQYSNGKIELFTQPGVHPTYGVPLQPITPKIAQLFNLQKEERLKKERDRQQEQEDKLKQGQAATPEQAVWINQRKFVPTYIKKLDRIGMMDEEGNVYDFQVLEGGEYYKPHGAPECSPISGLNTHAYLIGKEINTDTYSVKERGNEL